MSTQLTFQGLCGDQIHPYRTHNALIFRVTGQLEHVLSSFSYLEKVFGAFITLGVYEFTAGHVPEGMGLISLEGSLGQKEV